MKLITATILLMTGLKLAAQDSTGFSISGYAEVYYTFDFNTPADNNRNAFMYSHNRHNEFTANLIFLKANYNGKMLRANAALAAGTYMNANYSTEPGSLKNIYEANAGVKLSRKKNLWLDAGIFSSHIGFESAISKDCWALTRSLLADNSPYYEAGAKITYTSDNGKWLASVLALNGWQKIQRLDGNSLMSWGTQVQYKPSDIILINYSTFIGTDKPDSVRLLRFFHNVYGVFSLTSKLGLTIGFDIGSEEKTMNGNGANIWYSPVCILKYSLNNKWAVVARGEYYADNNGVIINTGSANGFKTSGYSFNVDYAPAKNVSARVEARVLTSKDNIFSRSNKAVAANSFITGSIAVSF
jgi:hypothetical protein